MVRKVFSAEPPLSKRVMTWITLVLLHGGFIPGLKGNQVPDLPGGVLSVVHQVSDQFFDDGIAEDPLLLNPFPGKMGVYEIVEIRFQPSADGHLEPPLGSGGQG